MDLSRALTLLVLASVGICGNYIELSELIERIYNDSDSATVNFVGVDNTLLSEFFRKEADIPVTVLKCLASDDNHKLNENVILVVQTPNENHQYTGLLQRFILQLRARKYVVISAGSLEHLHKFFIYFNEQKFTRIFGVADSISYVYLPYADNPVQQLRKTGHLPDALNNLNGFTIRTTILPDVPRVFWYTDKYGNRQIGGYAGNLFLNFLRKHNATYSLISISALGSRYMQSIWTGILNSNIDISMNPYALVDGLAQSYPLKLLSWNIMVPLNGYVNPNEYFLRPFSSTVWILIGITLLYIIVMDVLKDIAAGMPANVWHGFSRTFLIMLNMPAERSVTYAYRFHCQALLFAFVIVNYYSIHLTSFLTVFIKIKQYETIQDLIENKVPVIIIDYEWINNPIRQYFPVGFDNIVVETDYETYNKERKNTNYGYVVGKDKADFQLDLQKNFGNHRFHKVRDSLTEYTLGFQLAEYSPFREILSLNVIEIMDTGLIEKWTRDAIYQAREYNLANWEPSSQELLVKLTLDHLYFAWTILMIGLTVATVVLVAEWSTKGFLKRLTFKNIFTKNK